MINKRIIDRSNMLHGFNFFEHYFEIEAQWEIMF